MRREPLRRPLLDSPFEKMPFDATMEGKGVGEMYQKKLPEDIRCPLEYGLEVFGGKWKPRAICVLAERGGLRYSELRRELTDVTNAAWPPP